MKPIKVSQINKYIKTVLQSDPLLSKISVIGEVSNLKFHSSGHVFFSMKDSTSRINCFIAAGKVDYLQFCPEEGAEIVASGYIYLYEKGGSYSLNISDIRIEGEGNLAVAFEKLKKRLEKEGLFSPEFKKTIPPFPKTVGIVTSATGAAVWDMIRTIKNKNNCVDIILCPCLVQGDGAAADIEAAINAFNSMEEPPDVLIVGRGGGSAEELWAFNEERVAKSIFSSKIPVISAVGHETDFTIADFVADLRAATPTAAAEAAVPDIGEIRFELDRIKEEIRRSMERKIEYLSNLIDRYDPKHMAAEVKARIQADENRVDALMKDAVMLFKERLHREELRIEKLKSQLDTMNPERIMELGFGAISDCDEKLIKSVSRLKIGDSINIDMYDGRIKCVVQQISEKHI